MFTKVAFIGVPVLVAVNLNCLVPVAPERLRFVKSINELPKTLETVAPEMLCMVPDTSVAETVVTESKTGLS